MDVFSFQYTENHWEPWVKKQYPSNITFGKRKTLAEKKQSIILANKRESNNARSIIVSTSETQRLQFFLNFFIKYN